MNETKKNHLIIIKKFPVGLSIMTFFIVSLFVISYYNYRKDVSGIINLKLKEQQSVSELMKDKIEDWFERRKEDAGSFIYNNNFREDISDYLNNPLKDENKKILSEWMFSLKRNHNYKDILIADSIGNILFSFYDKMEFLTDGEKQHLIDGFHSNTISISDLYKRSDNKIYLNIVAPFPGTPGNKKVNSLVLFFLIDPGFALYPAISMIPLPGKTTESFIVEKCSDSDSIIFLSELELMKGSALNYKVSIKNIGLPAVKAVLRKLVSCVAKDYRGKDVLATSKKIAGTPWFLITKTDLDEINQPVNEKSKIFVLLIALLILLTTSFVLTVINRGKTKQYKELYDAKIAKEKAEQKFRLFFENSPVGKLITHIDGSITVNDSFCEMVGYTNEELEEIKPVNIIHRDDILKNSEIENALLHEKYESASYMNRFIHRNGSIVWTEIKSSLLKDDDGEPIFLINNIIDITERRKAEMALNVMSAHQDALLLAIPEIIMEIDLEKKYSWANEAGLAFFGDDVVGKATSNYFVGEQNVYSKIEHIFRGEEDITYLESLQKRKDGDDRVLAWYYHFLKDNEGNVTGAISTARDITNHKLTEQKIMELNYQLENMVNQRTRQLEIANRELEAFSYSVSHDLRAPLRAIDGFSRIIMEDYGQLFDKECLRLFGVIRTNIAKMNQLINDILDLSRSGKVDLVLLPFDMNELVRSSYIELTNADNRSKINFKILSLPETSCDKSLIQQVWVNLLSNSIKFLRPVENPEIIIGGEKDKDFNIYFIKDNGVGYNPEYSHKLFGVFQRLHKSEEFEGTGIGLAIVQRIVNRHGGRVWSESSVNEGATFYFSLPCKNKLEVKCMNNETIFNVQ